MRLGISGEYPHDWPEINAACVAAAGHRCIRCGHPYKKGEHGKGQWSPCDERCTHFGPLGMAEIGKFVVALDDTEPAGDLIRRTNSTRFAVQSIVAEWRILTVHHWDGNKSNCAWWNLMSLCQRCHLQIQGKAHPETPWILEHSEWCKPYAAGFYAKKYLGLELTREQAMARLDELLALERLA